MTRVRVSLPAHLRRLAKLPAGVSEVAVDVASDVAPGGAGAPTVARVLDALEALHPQLRGTIREYATGARRAYLRLYVCGEDISHEALDRPLPAPVLSGDEPLYVVGAIAGGTENGSAQARDGADVTRNQTPGAAGETASQDNIFDQEREPRDFEFREEVVAVFDDMVNRSVPYYGEIQRMLAEVVRDFAEPGTNLYDLGCATGNTLLAMHPFLDPAVSFVGVDDSSEMLEKCGRKFASAGVARPLRLERADIGRSVTIENASVVVLCLTLQFIRPIHREKLVRAIYEQLNPGGCLLLVEKLLCADPVLNRAYIRYYYDFKRRMKYSEMEIAQKREALENVLIPYTLGENETLLRECGFREVETFFRWYNFAGMVALK